MAPFLDFFEQGGRVIPVIVGLSILAWVLIAWEWLRLAGQSGGDWRWAERALEHLERGEPVPESLVRPYRFNLVGRLLAGGARGVPRTRAAFHRQLDPQLRSEEVELVRPLRFIGGLATVLPLLGLTGTVLGMMRSFDALMAGEAAQIESLAGGISEALYSTQAGLVAALPVLLAHGWLRARMRRYLDHATLMLKRIEHTVFGEGGA